MTIFSVYHFHMNLHIFYTIDNWLHKNSGKSCDHILFFFQLIVVIFYKFDSYTDMGTIGIHYKVLKPGPNHTIRSGKPQTAHFCSSFSLKNRSMGKKQGPMRTAVRPHSSKNRERFSWFLFFSKYWLKLKIWPACTLNLFQVWNQKICERKRKQTKKKQMTK